MKNRVCAILHIGLLFILAPPYLIASTVLHKMDRVDLSNNAIICMHQDPDGYLWIGTYDGLNLYNGKDTYVYRFELNNKNSLCSNIIHKISDAEPGYLWISTSLGLNKFSLKERKITESYPGYIECDLLATDSSGNTLTICKDSRISWYPSQSDGFQDLPGEGISPSNVKTLFATPDGHFYLLLTSGMLKRLTPDFSATHFNLLSEEHLFHEKEILSAFQENNTLFFVDKEEKLYRSSIDGSHKVLIHDLTGMTRTYGYISNICSFQSGLYIAFRNGTILDLSRPESPQDFGIGIFCLMKDKRQDILWVGTDGQGIHMFYDKPDLFGSILLKDLPVNIQNPIRSLYTDEDGSLWLGTKGDGIIRIQSYDTYYNKPVPTHAIRHFTDQEGLSSNRVYCFAKSKYHPLIWIGTEGPGLSFYSYPENRIRTINLPADIQNIRYVHAICEANDSTLWLATTGKGLLKVSLRKGGSFPEISQVSTYPLKNGENHCNEIQAMVFDQDSTLFLGSRGGYGLVRFNIFSKHYNFLQNNNLENPAIGDVLSVCQTGDSTLYVGASSGLTHVQLNEGKMGTRQFDKNNGIANDMIHGILLGSDSCLWLSTNKGLTKYNPQNDFFHNYHQPNFNVTEFSDDAYWKCPYSDRLFFGGINGLAWINKQSTPKSSYQPDLKFFEAQMDKRIQTLYKDIGRDGVNGPGQCPITSDCVCGSRLYQRGEL